MTELIAISLGAFALSLLLTPLCRSVALRFRCLDFPDFTRKLHTRPTPRIGGVVIVAAWLFVRPIPGALAALLVMFAAGLWDDLFGLEARNKFAIQLAAATLAWLGGIRIAGGAWWTAPVTIVWLVACANAFNLIDGMDGLAGGLGVIAALAVLAAAWMHGHYPLAMASALLAGALCGFLPYNLRRASVFLGDCGSLSLGFMLGVCGIVWCNQTDSRFGVAAPLIALSIPLLDTGLAVARRRLSGRPIFSADRGHIHHRLLERGWSQSRVTLVLCGMGAIAAGASFLVTAAPDEYACLTLVGCGTAACAGIQSLRYAEFHIAPRIAGRKPASTDRAVPSPAAARRRAYSALRS